MPLSTKEDRPSPAAAEAVVHAALDAGVTLIDTADAYAHDESEFGHNEELVANALRSYGRADVLVATKGGHTRSAHHDFPSVHHRANTAAINTANRIPCRLN